MTALEVRNLHKRYGPHAAVDDVSFTVEEGEIFGIIGSPSSTVDGLPQWIRRQG